MKWLRRLGEGGSVSLTTSRGIVDGPKHGQIRNEGEENILRVVGAIESVFFDSL